MRPSPARARTSGARWPRRLALLAVVAGLLLALLPAAVGAQEDDPAAGLVEVVQIEGPLDQPVVSHIERALERAAEDDAEVVVLELDSPGALRTDPGELAERIDASDVPVVAWVGPAGAEVTGGAAVVAQSAHVLAMAPASVLGGAGVLDLADAQRGESVPTIDGRSAGEALAAYASARGRDAELARGMAEGGAVVALGHSDPGEVASDALPWGVEPDRATMLGDADLVEQGAADVAAGELPDVLRAVDGVDVMTAAGDRAIALDPVDASVRFDNLPIWGAVLHGVTSPTLAYLLVVGGLLAILFEAFQPGLGVPGLTGVALAAAGSWGLWVLPVAWWAALLVLAGLALLAIDLAIGGLGWVTFVGTAALGIGSWRLFDGPAPLQPVGWGVALIVVFCVVFFVGIMTAVLRAQGQQALSGADQVLGETGVVRSMLNPEGHVFVGGALWRARVVDDVGRVATGTPVRVTALDAEREALSVEVVAAEAVSDG